MNTHTHIGLALAALAGLLCSCQNAQHDAQQSLAAALATRQENQIKSMHLYEQGASAQKASRLEEAHACFVAAVEADGDNPYAWMALGALEFDRGDYYRAAEAFHLASRLAPTRYEPHFNAGTVYEATGHYDAAIKAYETALRLEPEQVEIMENLARTCICANRNLSRARELIDQALLRERRPAWRQWLLLQSVRLASAPPANPQTQPRAESPLSATVEPLYPNTAKEQRP